jgi:hypothetical protein
MDSKEHDGFLVDHVLPTEELTYTCLTKGMTRRLGDHSRKSWALSHVHIAYIDSSLNTAFLSSVSAADRHDLAVAATVNLLGYLGWLRGGETFGLSPDDISVTAPANGPTLGLKPGIGVVELTLLPETKSNPAFAADVIIAFECLSGLSLGRWLDRLLRFQPLDPSRLFSTAHQRHWTSRYFRERYAWPLLERQRASGEPTLQVFTDQIGHRIEDKIYGFHSWRRAGRSRVNRTRRPDELLLHGRCASPTEVDEHGRWTRQGKGEAMQTHYNQWNVEDRVAITLFCM